MNQFETQYSIKIVQHVVKQKKEMEAKHKGYLKFLNENERIHVVEDEQCGCRSLLVVDNEEDEL